MATILVAASPEPRAILERILAGHQLFCAEGMVQAEQFLGERTFDLIICTIVFDESRMFDFLRLAQARLEGNGAPLLFRPGRGELHLAPNRPAISRRTCRGIV